MTLEELRQKAKYEIERQELNRSIVARRLKMSPASISLVLDPPADRAHTGEKLLMKILENLTGQTVTKTYELS